MPDPKETDKVASIEPPVIVLSIFGVAAAASIVFIGWYGKVVFDSNATTNEKWQSIIPFSTSTIGVAATAASAFYVGKGIRLNLTARKEELESQKNAKIEDRAIQAKLQQEAVNEKRKDRAIAYIDAWTNPTFANTVRQALREVGEVVDDESDKRKHPDLVRTLIREDPVLEEHVITALNVLEQVSTGIQNDYADEELLKNYFSAIVKRSYFILAPWIDDRRKIKSAPALFESVEWLYNHWENNGR